MVDFFVLSQEQIVMSCLILGYPAIVLGLICLFGVMPMMIEKSSGHGFSMFFISIGICSLGLSLLSQGLGLPVQAAAYFISDAILIFGMSLVVVQYRKQIWLHFVSRK